MTLPTNRAAPGGVWTPAPGTPWAPPPLHLGDDIDAQTGELRSLTRGIHPVDSWVITQIRTVYGRASAMPEDGHMFGRFELVTADAVDLARAEIERLLRPAVERGDLRVDDVQVEELPNASGVAVLVVWTNLRTSQTSAPMRFMPAPRGSE